MSLESNVQARQLLRGERQQPDRPVRPAGRKCTNPIGALTASDKAPRLRLCDGHVAGLHLTLPAACRCAGYHSRASASAGSRYAALRAGRNPNTTPMTLDTVTAATIENVEKTIGKPPEIRDNTKLTA